MKILQRSPIDTARTRRWWRDGGSIKRWQRRWDVRKIAFTVKKSGNSLNSLVKLKEGNLIDVQWRFSLLPFCSPKSEILGILNVYICNLICWKMILLKKCYKIVSNFAPKEAAHPLILPLWRDFIKNLLTIKRRNQVRWRKVLRSGCFIKISWTTRHHHVEGISELKLFTRSSLIKVNFRAH